MLLRILVYLPGNAFAFLGSSQLSTKVQVKGPLWGRLTPNPLLMLQLPWGQVDCQNRCKDVPNDVSVSPLTRLGSTVPLT